MKLLTRLFERLSQTTRTNEKLAALEEYFRSAPPADAAWGLFFLTGGRIQRAVQAPLLTAWTAEAAALPVWLVDECQIATGDFAEALALLFPDSDNSWDPPLHRLVEERLLPLRALAEDQRRALLLRTWAELNSSERLVWNKLIIGEFRLGAARTLVVRALAAVARVEPAVILHRLMGNWRPVASDYQKILSGDAEEADPARPYPFYLAYAIDADLSRLSDPGQWQAEWKWDGIRSQMIRRAGQVFLWSRGEDLITDRFPELRDAAQALLPDGTVLDGEVLGWCGDKPLPFADLQKRIGRRKPDAELIRKVPVSFVAYDLLEYGGEDIRSFPLAERRARLQALLRDHQGTLRISPVIAFSSWEYLRDVRERSRELRVEGVMLKRLAAPYGVGRVRGDWWKWKVDPYTIDAVLIYAEPGHGRRATLYTDYTFGVWNEGRLVPVAKAYSGLSDEEIREMDSYIRRNTLQKHGPVRVIAPTQVFEIAFEGIQESARHKAGLAVRFPRIARWRKDKKPEEADTLETLRAMYQAR